MSAPRHALSGWSGRGHSGEAEERGDPDGDSADDREDRLPGRGWHRHMREEQDDQEPQPGPRHEAERELADAEGRVACDQADEDAAKHAGAGVEGPDADRQADEKREGEHSKGEQQPADETDADDDEQWSKDDHGGGLR